MTDPQYDIRLWMQAELEKRPHGTKGALAAYLGVRPDAVTRMANTDPAKETREIRAHEHMKMREFFAAADHVPQRDTLVAAPLISWVSAGALAQPDVPAGDGDAPIALQPDLDPNGDWIALRVDGDSMNRISPHDSIIFVNRRDRRLVPNACYIIGDGEGGATYKRYRPPNTWEPVSTNPAHKPFVLKPGTEPDIIGRVRKTVLAM